MDFYFQVQKCPGQLLELQYKKVTIQLLNGFVVSGWVYTVDILNNVIGLTQFIPDPEHNMQIDRTAVHAFAIRDVIINVADKSEFVSLALNYPESSDEIEKILRAFANVKL